MTDLFLVAVFSALGAFWRWWDGRGWGIYPGQTKLKSGSRLIVCAALSLTIVYPMTWWAALVTSALMALIWLPQQKQREEWDDMMLRWAVPFATMGLAIALMTGALWAVPLMGAGGDISKLLSCAATQSEALAMRAVASEPDAKLLNSSRITMQSWVPQNALAMT